MATAEVTITSKVVAWIFGGGFTAMLAFFLKRLIAKNDEAHKDSKREIERLKDTITGLATTINELSAQGDIAKKDIDALNAQVKEIEEIGTQLQRAFEIEEALKKKEEMDTLKALADAHHVQK